MSNPDNIIILHNHKKAILTCIQNGESVIYGGLYSHLQKEVDGFDWSLMDEALSELQETKKICVRTDDNGDSYYSNMSYISPEYMHILYRDVIIDHLLESVVASRSQLKLACMDHFFDTFDDNMFNQAMRAFGNKFAHIG